MRIGACSAVSLAAVCWLAAPPRASSQPTVTFDFEAVSLGQATPFAQTTGGITATFSSVPALAYFVDTTVDRPSVRLSKFSGHYLSNRDSQKSTLQIRFSQALAGVSLTFATNDVQVEVPSPLQLDAYLDSTAVDSVTARGSYGPDTMAMGTLSFTSMKGPFNRVELSLPFVPRGATVFVVDNVIVTPSSGSSPTFACVSAASYTSGAPLAPAGIAAGFATGLAPAEEWAASLPLPTTLPVTGTRLDVTDSAGKFFNAPLFYAGPTQINWLVPEGIAAGPASVNVIIGSRLAATGSVRIEPVAPSFFTANQNGKGVPAGSVVRVAPDNTQTALEVARCTSGVGSCTALPLDLGTAGTTVILVLYGTGIRARSSPSAVTAMIGGMPADVQYAGPQNEYAGLDQVNLVIPRELAGRGEVDVVVTVDGKTANTVQVNIR